MSRYIDTEKFDCLVFEGKSMEFVEGAEYVLNLIDNTPTEDVVKVVHCKDCEHFAYSEELNQLHKCENLGYCDYMNVQSDNCYCNFGEEKSNPDEIYMTEVREVVHGKWMRFKDGYYHCSRCYAKARWNHDGSMQCRTIYCPDCGANMDGES